VSAISITDAMSAMSVMSAMSALRATGTTTAVTVASSSEFVSPDDHRIILIDFGGTWNGFGTGLGAGFRWVGWVGWGWMG
jgi:hypothetical protein